MKQRLGWWLCLFLAFLALLTIVISNSSSSEKFVGEVRELTGLRLPDAMELSMVNYPSDASRIYVFRLQQDEEEQLKKRLSMKSVQETQRDPFFRCEYVFFIEPKVKNKSRAFLLTGVKDDVDWKMLYDESKSELKIWIGFPD